MKKEYIFMNVIAPLFIMAPIILLVLRYRFLPMEGKVLLYYLLTDTLVSTASSILAFNHITNLPLYHISTMVETVLLLFFFFFLFYGSKTARYVKLAIVLFPIAGLINILFLQSIHQFNSYMLSLQSLLMMALCFLYWLQYEGDESIPWMEIPLNWIIAGLLLYFASAFILLTFSNIIITFSKSMSIAIWNIHATLNILMYFMLCLGIRKYKHA